MFNFNKAPSAPTVEDPSTKALESVKKDAMLSKSYESFAGIKDKAGNDMQEKFLKAVTENPGQPIGYNRFDDSFLPVAYSGFN